MRVPVAPEVPGRSRTIDGTTGGPGTDADEHDCGELRGTAST